MFFAHNLILHVPLQRLNKLVEALHLAWNIDALRTMTHTFATSNAMVCLTEFRYGTVITYEVVPALTTILRTSLVMRHITFLYHLVIMCKDGRYIYSVWTRHTVVALVARNGLEVIDVLCHRHKEIILFLRDRLEWCVCTYVVTQVFHVCHSREYTKHAFWCSCEAESP